MIVLKPGGTCNYAPRQILSASFERCKVNGAVLNNHRRVRQSLPGTERKGRAVFTKSEFSGHRQLPKISHSVPAALLTAPQRPRGHSYAAGSEARSGARSPRPAPQRLIDLLMQFRSTVAPRSTFNGRRTTKRRAKPWELRKRRAAPQEFVDPVSGQTMLILFNEIGRHLPRPCSLRYGGRKFGVLACRLGWGRPIWYVCPDPHPEPSLNLTIPQ